MGGVIEVAADDPCISIGLTQRRIAEDPPLIEHSSLIAQGAIRYKKKKKKKKKIAKCLVI